LQCPCARLSSISRTSLRDFVHEALQVLAVLYAQGTAPTSPSPTTIVLSARTTVLHPNVSHSDRCPRVVSQLPTYLQQCLRSIQKAHEERPSCSPTRRPATDLQLSQRCSPSTSTASRGAQSVSEQRWEVDKVARPYCECLVRLLRNTWRGCWPGMLHDIGSSQIYTHAYSQIFSPAKVIFAGVGVLLLVRTSSLLLSWGQL